MISAYYRLFYSKDAMVRDRRLQKALRSENGKILMDLGWLRDLEALASAQKNFQAQDRQVCFFITHHELQDLSRDEVRFFSEYFSEIVLEFSTDESSLSGHLESLYLIRHKVSSVIHFSGAFDFESFFPLLPLWVREKIYFHPCAKGLSAKQIFTLGKKIEKSFPGTQFLPLAGLDHYDHRIPQEVELELLGEKLFESRLEGSSVEISFIIPTHNNQEFLKNCLRHLLALQAPRKTYEIVVVDDGSTELDLKDLESFLAPEKNLFNLSYYYVAKKDVGSSMLGRFRAGLCRNLGVFHSVGSVLSFLDSDMLVPPDYIQCIQNSLKENDIVQFVRKHIQPRDSSMYTDYVTVPAKSLFVEEAPYWGPFFQSHSWMAIPDYWKYTCTYSLSLRREQFKALGTFRRTFVSYGFEDTDFGYRAHLKGLRFHLEKTPLLHLTHFTDKARYHHSMFHKHKLLRITAKTFYVNHLSPEIYNKMRSLLD